MKKFLLRILLFYLLPLPLLFLLGAMVDNGLHRSRFLYYADWNDLYSGTINADVLVLGTSRAYVHVDPKILDTSLHVNSYNLGMDGASFDIQNDILKLYLRHNKKPAYILQEVGYPTFVKSDSVQYFHEFLSYLNDTAVWNIVKRHYAPLGPIDLYFPLCKYNGSLPLVAEGLRSYVGMGKKDIKYKGYEGRNYPWDSSFYQFKKNNPQGKTMIIDTGVVSLFSAYLDWCAVNGIKVILFYPPTYYESKPYILNFTAIHKMIADCAAAHGVPFLDYTDDSMNYNKSYFYNTQHLNKRGSEIFSKNLAGDIRRVIK